MTRQMVSFAAAWTALIKYRREEIHSDINCRLAIMQRDTKDVFHIFRFILYYRIYFVRM